MSEPAIRLYVPGRKVGSFRSLRLGFEEGLRQLGVPYSVLDYSESPDEDGWSQVGASAPIGIYLGSPTHLELMSVHTRHVRRFLMLAPNGYGIPAGLVQELVDRKVEVLTPSAWGKTVIDEYPAAKAAGIRATVVPHGVLSEPDESWRLTLPPHLADHGSSRIRLLHVTSCLGNRKGTDELLMWLRGLDRDLLWRDRVHLTIKADTFGASEWDDRAKSAGLSTSQLRVVTKMDGVSWASYLRGFHGVVQPSAAEGFGLCNLEAAAFGVPNVTTDSTGQDYVRTHQEAFPYIVPSGPRKTPRGEPYAGHPPERRGLSAVMTHFLSEVQTGEARLRSESVASRVRQDYSWSSVLTGFLTNLDVIPF